MSDRYERAKKTVTNLVDRGDQFAGLMVIDASGDLHVTVATDNSARMRMEASAFMAAIRGVAEEAFAEGRTEANPDDAIILDTYPEPS